YRLWPGVLDSIAVIQPDTLVRWHRRGFRALWQWKSRRHLGRPGIAKDVRNLIREISRPNPLWGAEGRKNSIRRPPCRNRRSDQAALPLNTLAGNSLLTRWPWPDPNFLELLSPRFAGSSRSLSPQRECSIFTRSKRISTDGVFAPYRVATGPATQSQPHSAS